MKIEEISFFSSNDNRFQVEISSSLVEKMLSYCTRDMTLETGGILIGYYQETLHKAVLTRITDAPKDSKHKRRSFFRGTKGLMSILHKVWSRKQYYIGEWHFHPLSAAQPSAIDIKQMAKFAENTKLNCPEPILIIIGGDPTEEWEIQVIVYDRDTGIVNLNKIS